MFIVYKMLICKNKQFYIMLKCLTDNYHDFCDAFLIETETCTHHVYIMWMWRDTQMQITKKCSSYKIRNKNKFAPRYLETFTHTCIISCLNRADLRRDTFVYLFLSRPWPWSLTYFFKYLTLRITFQQWVIELWFYKNILCNNIFLLVLTLTKKEL